MERQNRALCLVLGTVVATACGQPAQELADEDVDTSEPAIERIDRTSEAFASVARETLDELDRKVEEITASQDATRDDATPRTWALQEILRAQQEVEANLTELREVTGERARALRAETADVLSSLTQQIERARLDTAADAQDFVAISTEQLQEVRDDIETMTTQTDKLAQEARDDAMTGITVLETEADGLASRLGSIANGTPEEISDVREELAEEIAWLSASVQRRWLEIQVAEGA